MAFSYLKLTEITPIPDTETVVYNNPSSVTSYIRLIVIHNPADIPVTIKLWNVPDNVNAVGTPVDANQFHEELLQPKATRMLEYQAPGIMLTDTADTLQVKASSAVNCTIQVYGGLDA